MNLFGILLGVLLETCIHVQIHGYENMNENRLNECTCIYVCIYIYTYGKPNINLPLNGLLKVLTGGGLYCGQENRHPQKNPNIF